MDNSVCNQYWEENTKPETDQWQTDLEDQGKELKVIFMGITT